jgi:serine/threonine protein kinase
VIVASLGDGLHAARDTRSGRGVALKVIEAEGPRLLAEAQAAARVRSPYVVPVHDVMLGGGNTMLVMEHAGETTLRAHLPSAATLERKVRWLCDLARGLAAIHAVGLVHRDVEPRHVRIGRDDRARLDLGVALRGDGVHAGSPGYIAPEQLATGSADARCDQYAWAVTAYELLVGRKPVGDLRARRDVAAHGPDLPRNLAAVVGRALAIDPDARFPSLAAVADALAPFCPPDEPAATLHLPPVRRRGPGIAAGVALGAVAMVVLGIVAFGVIA